VARKPNPKRIKAFELFKKHVGNITNREIGKQLDVPEKTISAWKCRDKWNEKLGIKTKCSTVNNRSTTNNKRQEQQKRIIDALVEAGTYSPALDLLIDLYLDAYEEYQINRTDKLRKEMASYLKELGLNNTMKIKRNTGNQGQKEPIQEAKEQKSDNKLLQFRRKFAK